MYAGVYISFLKLASRFLSILIHMEEGKLAGEKNWLYTSRLKKQSVKQKQTWKSLLPKLKTVKSQTVKSIREIPDADL